MVNFGWIFIDVLVGRLYGRTFPTRAVGYFEGKWFFEKFEKLFFVFQILSRECVCIFFCFSKNVTFRVNKKLFLPQTCLAKNNLKNKSNKFFQIFLFDRNFCQIQCFKHNRQTLPYLCFRSLIFTLNKKHVSK